LGFRREEEDWGPGGRRRIGVQAGGSNSLKLVPVIFTFWNLMTAALTNCCATADALVTNALLN